MASKSKLDAGRLEDLSRLNKLSGIVAVFSGDYPSLTPEQLQAFKIGRFQWLTVATCVVRGPDGKPPTYWIAAIAYE
jgi:hypothetical protein